MCQKMYQNVSKRFLKTTKKYQKCAKKYKLLGREPKRARSVGIIFPLVRISKLGFYSAYAFTLPRVRNKLPHVRIFRFRAYAL